MATYDHYFYRKSPGSFTTGSIAINVTASTGTFSRATGSFVTDEFVAGHTINVSGFTNSGNNNPRIIQTVTATTITVVDSTGLVDETGTGDEVIQIGWSPNIISNIFNFSISREVGNEISKLTFELVYTQAISQYDMIRIRKNGDADTDNIFVGVVSIVQTVGNKKSITAYDMLIYAKRREYNPSTQPGSITTKEAFINLCSAAELSDDIDATVITNGNIDWTFSHANVFEKMQKVAQITTSAGPVGWQFYHDPTQLNGGAYNKVKFAPRATTLETNYYYAYTGQTTNIKDVSFTENGDDIINDVTVIGGKKTQIMREPESGTYASGYTYYPPSANLKYFPNGLDNASDPNVGVWEGANKKTLNVDYVITSNPKIAFFSPTTDTVYIKYYYTSSPEKSASDTTSKNTYGTRKKTIYRSDITDETVLQNLADAIIASISASGFKDPIDEVTFKTSPTTSVTLGGKSNVYDGLHNITKTGLTTYSITYSYPEGMNTVTCSNRPIRNPIAQLALEDRVKRNEEYIASATDASSSYATNPMGKDLDMGKNQITNVRIHNSASNPANLGIGGIYYKTGTGEEKLYYNKNGTWTEIGSGTLSPSGTVADETSFGLSLNAGSASTYSRGDHTHGSPTHNKAVHDALNINADTVDNYHAISFGILDATNNWTGAQYFKNSSGYQIAIYGVGGGANSTMPRIMACNNTYAVNTYYEILRLDDAGKLHWKSAEGTIFAGGSVLPESTGISDIGSSSLWWKNIYSQKIYLQDASYYIDVDPSEGNKVMKLHVPTGGKVQIVVG